MPMNRLKIALAVFLFSSSLALAEITPPDQLVRTQTDRIIELTKKNRDAYNRDHSQLYEMVDREVLPHFDFRAMSRLVLGQSWREASEAQRESFVQEFRDLLVRTYATALLKYTDEQIKYYPLRAAPDDKQVLVRTEVLQSGG